ncbi:MAG: hypothetical protein ACL93V_04865 [Candidatus Electrothrix sp. YB6]
MKCILHIGTEKTGTTSLQEFFHQNREILSRNGYLYTKSAGLRNNRLLSLAAYDSERRDAFTKSLRICCEQDLIQYQNATIKALKGELKQAQGIHTVIFSSEHFQSRLQTDEEVSRLKIILNDLGLYDISIVVYLRPPADIANSLYTTYVIFGGTEAHPPGPENEYWHNVCDHRATLTRFRNQFGTETVIPRIFSTIELVNGSILDDFAEIIGLSLAQEKYVIPMRQNESIPTLALEIIRRINKAIPPLTEDQQPNELRGNIILYVLSNLKDGETYSMPMDLRQQYEDTFREGNEWVRSEYFPSRQKLFEPKRISRTGSCSLSASELDQVARIISEIWIDKSRELATLQSSRAYQMAMKLSRQKKRVIQLRDRLIRLMYHCR